MLSKANARDAIISKQIGEHIKRRRNAAKMTLAGMAVAVGVTRQNADKYEKGEISIPAVRLYRIAEVLNVPAGSLFPGNGGEDDLADLLDQADAIRLLRAWKFVCGKWRPCLLEIIEVCASKMYPSCTE